MNRTEKRKRTSLYVADYRRNIKKRAVEYKGERCTRCGYNKSVAALDFHHRDPAAKEFRLSAGKTWSWERIKPELDKCDLVCKNCHSEIHEEWRKAAIERQRGFLAQFARKPHVIIPCSHCGNPIKKLASQIRRYTHFFCNKKCQGLFRIQPPKPNENRLGKTKIDWPGTNELKALVWQIPMTSLAKKLGVSDKAIKKHCRKLSIGTPGPGYWSQQP